MPYYPGVNRSPIGLFRPLWVNDLRGPVGFDSQPAVVPDSGNRIWESKHPDVASYPPVKGK